MAVLTMEVSERHTRARAIIRDHVFPANRAIGGGERVSRGDARVVSDVSVLCPASVAEIGNSPLDIAA